MIRRIAVLLFSTLLTLSVSTRTTAAVGNGARAMGMGGAFSAIAGDTSTYYWNPAGMAGLSGYTPIFDVSVSQELLNIAFSNNIDAYLENIVKNSKNQANLSWEYANLGLGCSSPHWGLNLYSQNLLLIATTSVLNQTNVYFAQPQYMRVDSLTLSFAGDITPDLNWGLNLSLQNRSLYLVKAFYVNDPAYDYAQVESTVITAGGYTSDLGLLYHPDSKWSFSLVVKDLLNHFNYSYKHFNLSLEEPGIREGDIQGSAIPEYTTGMAYQNPDWGLTCAGDYRWPSGDKNGNLALGIEAAVCPWILLRAGYSKDDNSSEAMKSVGLGVKAGDFSADFAGISLFNKWAYTMTLSYRF